MHARFLALLLVVLVVALGCRREPKRPSDAAVDPAEPPPAATIVSDAPKVVVGGDRPATVFVPSRYRAGTPMPLVVMLHGYGVSGELVEWILRLKPQAERRGFLYVHPDGTPNAEGKRFWNATDACCAPKGSAPDDVEYLRELIGETASKLSVDARRIYVLGYSNGAFMAQRLACDHAELVAGVVSIAGATWSDASKCKPSAPVAMLLVHGTADATVRYEGGVFFGRPYPSARTTAERWAAIDGCKKTPVSGGTLDLDREHEGAESKVLRFEGCEPGVGVELWTIEGGTHVPAPTEELRTRALDFLFAHEKS